jgi:hypothetical protein
VNGETVWRWRKTFGVGRLDPEGSQRLHQKLSEKGADKLRGKRLPKRVINKMMGPKKLARKPRARRTTRGP